MPSVVPSFAEGQRILWNDPLFGRLIQPGRNLLLRNGWQFLDSPPQEWQQYCRKWQEQSKTTASAWPSTEIDEGDKTDSSTHPPPLALIWPNKSGPQYPTNVVGPALARPLPTHLTDIVDDKISLHQLLADTDLMPPTVDIDAIESIHSSSEAEGKDQLYFVKHRYGAQGKSVYVHTLETLREWKEKCNNPTDYIIECEVVPKLDGEGRKVALRAHILVYNDNKVEGEVGEGNVDGINGFACALHQDVICHTHPMPYTKDIDSRPAHISNACSKSRSKRKKRSPMSVLIEDVPSSHPAYGQFDQIQQCSTVLCQRFVEHLHRSGEAIIAPGITCFALLGADFLIDIHGTVKLCEINSHPALGWGTMTDVKSEIYRRLVEVVLELMVLRDKGLDETGFVSLNVTESDLQNDVSR